MKQKQRQDPEWQAFWDIMNLPIWQSKRDTILQYVDENREEIDWSALEQVMGPWSHGEQVLIRIARTLFNGTDDIPIHELRVLDDRLGPAVLTIIQKRYWG